MKKKQLMITFLFFIVLCFVVELCGRFWTQESLLTWYPTLIKPSWTPPNWVFPIVWTTLYVMIALSGALIYCAEHSLQRTRALMFYGFQLALNFIWSFLFFSLQSPLLGLVDIIPLCVFTVLTINKAWHVDRWAGLLLVPYFIWITYAMTLNAGLWWLNS